MTGAEEALLLRMVEQLRDDFAADREARARADDQARESRAATHRRIDEVIDRLGKIETTAAIGGQIDAQVRTELNDLGVRITRIQPTVDEWSRIRALGIGIVSAIGVGGLSIGAMVASGNEWLADTIRHWLRIN